jgi:predicted DNA-binding protein with PD1-like motif
MFRVAFCLLLLHSAGFSQLKRTGPIAAPATANDKKPLDPKVPDSTAISTQFERIVVIRLKHQTDILAAIEQQVKAQKITNAIILSGFGSAISTHYHVVANRAFPPTNYFLEDPTEDADIVNINGAVFNGRVHAHITFADDKKAFGGHLEPRTKVFTFSVITLGVLPASLDTSRYDDKDLR